MPGYWSRLSQKFRGPKQAEFAEVVSSAGRDSREQAIPPICRQTALSRWVHPDHLESIEEIRTIQSDLSFEFYDDGEVGQNMKDRWKSEPIYEVFPRARIGQIRADIFRYCITFERGGHYLDLSKGCYAPLSSMHAPDAGGIVAFERN